MIVVDSRWNHNLDYHLQIVNHNNGVQKDGMRCGSKKAKEGERLRESKIISEFHLNSQEWICFWKFHFIRVCECWISGVREKRVWTQNVYDLMFFERFVNDEAGINHYYLYFYFYFHFCALDDGGWWWHTPNTHPIILWMWKCFDCCLPVTSSFTPCNL